MHETAAVRGQSGSVCFVPSTRSDADVAQHGAFVKKFVATNLLPRLEKKLLKLNTQIAGTRKGLKNQFKTFWGRSSSGVGGGGLLGSTFGGLMGGGTGASTGGDGAKNVSGDSGYSFRSPESEIRLAADLSFALFDHEGAVAHFKLLQADFKADKAFRRLGCSLESAAHALVCAGGGVASNSSQIGKELRKEIEQTFDAATAAHGKAVVSSSGASPKDPASTDALLHEKQEKCAWVTRVSLSHATVRVAFPKSRHDCFISQLVTVVHTSRYTRPAKGALRPEGRIPSDCYPDCLRNTNPGYTHYDRLTLFFSKKFLAAVGDHRNAAVPLTKASGEETQPHFAAASFLEAAGFSFLNATPPLPRKFAMHLVLAGHRYAQGGMRGHAIRCYASALPVYRHVDGSLTGALNGASSRMTSEDAASTSSTEGNSTGTPYTSSAVLDAADFQAQRWHEESSVKAPWCKAREHLHFALGRQIGTCGSLPNAQVHFKRLLQCVDNSSETAQATYLAEFTLLRNVETDGVSTSKENGLTDNVTVVTEVPDSGRHQLGDPGMPLPEIDVGDVCVGLLASASDSFDETFSNLSIAFGKQSEKTPKRTFPCQAWSDAQWLALQSEAGLVPPSLLSQQGGLQRLRSPRRGRGAIPGVCCAFPKSGDCFISNAGDCSDRSW